MSPSGQRRQRRSPHELDKLAVEAAHLTYEDGLGTVVVARRLNLRGSRDVASLLQRAKRLVDVSVLPRGQVPVLDLELAKKLCRILRLRHAYVVRTEGSSGLASPDPTTRRNATTDLHRALGHVAGDHLLTIIRPGDNIGVCAGRGVGYTIERIRAVLTESDATALRLEASHGRVFSLAGGVFLPTWTENGLQYLDNADYNADVLATALRWDRTLCCVRAFRRDEASRDATIERDAKHLLNKRLGLHIALYGATILDEDHYLRRIQDDPQVEAIEPERALLDEIASDEHAPAAVLDHCEHFYPAADLSQRQKKKVQGLVTRLNQKSVSADPDIVNAAGERILVAGGPRKLPALSILTRTEWRGPRPTTLITDKRTAHELLSFSL